MRDNLLGSTVGVVIPVFNGAACLNEALASVAAQQRRPDAVVVVDDGSTDESSQIADSWLGRLPLKVIVRQANGGLAAARRTAIEELDTDLVALLDHDDVWLPDHLSEMTAAFATNQGLVTANALRWLPGRSLGRVGSAEANPIPDLSAQFVRLIHVNFVFVGTLFERATYLSVGGFRDGFGGAEDWDLWLRMVRSGVRVSAPRSPTVLYRVHPGSMSAGYALIPNAIAVLEGLLNDVRDSSVRTHICRALREQRARVALSEAYAFARSSRRGASRARAVAALHGASALRTRAAVMLCNPGRGVARRDQLVADIDRQVRW